MNCTLSAAASCFSLIARPSVQVTSRSPQMLSAMATKLLPHLVDDARLAQVHLHQLLAVRAAVLAEVQHHALAFLRRLGGVLLDEQQRLGEPGRRFLRRALRPRTARRPANHRIGTIIAPCCGLLALLARAVRAAGRALDAGHRARRRARLRRLAGERRGGGGPRRLGAHARRRGRPAGARRPRRICRGAVSADRAAARRRRRRARRWSSTPESPAPSGPSASSASTSARQGRIELLKPRPGAISCRRRGRSW